MLWGILALGAAFASFGLALPILVHAFRRSLGTGVMVSLIPGYILVYAFIQFEDRHRHWMLPALLGALVLAAVFMGLARVVDPAQTLPSWSQ